MPVAPLPGNETERLAALHSYGILDTAHEAAFDNLTRLAARLTGYPTALVSLVDESRLWIKAHHGLDMTETHRDIGFCAHAILDPAHVLIVRDATMDDRFSDNPLVTGEPGIRFYAGAPLVNSEGYALGALCLIDYTPRIIAQQTIETLSDLAQAVMASIELHKEKHNTDLKEQSVLTRFVRLLEAMPTALIFANKFGRIQMINQQAEKMFGYGRAELDGQQIELLLPERYRGHHVELRNGFLLDMSSRMMGEGQPVFGRRKDGGEFPLEIGLNPIDLDGEVVTLAAIVDIGPRHRVEQEREQQRRDLERSNADLQDFAYAASHDLKAPLRAIAHLADWIGTDINRTASIEMLDNLALLQSRVARMQMLLDNLLAYSRVGRTEAKVENVDIAEIISDVATLLEVPLGFKVVYLGTMTMIRAHRSPLQMVLRNLIGNGIQHHDRDTGQVTVSTSLLDDFVEFRVMDDGPGIPKRFQERVFQIFQTLKPRDDTESAGFGLAIVKKQVESNFGQIRVESDPPARGSTFIFTWKMSPADCRKATP